MGLDSNLFATENMIMHELQKSIGGELSKVTSTSFNLFPILCLQAIHPKLIENNYRYWHAQTLYMVEAHGLREYFTGLVLCLVLFVYLNIDGVVPDTKQPNLEYFVWRRYDKLLMS